MNEEKKDRGYIQLNRKELSNTPWYYKEKFSKQRAFEYLLYHANYQDTMEKIKGHDIPLKRGQLCRSIKNLAKTWRWDRKAVRRFFDELKKMGYAHYEPYPEKGKTITSITTLYVYDKIVPNWNRDSKKKEKRDTGKSIDNKGYTRDFLKKRDTGETEKGDTDNNYSSLNKKDRYLNSSNTHTDISNIESTTCIKEQNRPNNIIEELELELKNKKKISFDENSREGRFEKKIFERSLAGMYEKIKKKTQNEVI